MRCVLLVPPRLDCLGEALVSGASSVVADLTVEMGSPDHGRAAVSTWLRDTRMLKSRPGLFVQIHDLSDAEAEGELDALFPLAPDGIMLRDCRSPDDVQRLGARLAVREAEHDLPHQSIGILACVGASASGVLAMGRSGEFGPRLRGMTWDRDALASDLGLDPVEDAPALAYARVLTVLTARAAGVPALDWDMAGATEAVIASCQRRRREGFRGALTRDAALAGPIADTYGVGEEGSRLRTR